MSGIQKGTNNIMARIAVAGAGYWGKNLIRNFHHLGMLYAICESDPDNPNLAPYKEKKRYTVFDELLKDSYVHPDLCRHKKQDAAQPCLPQAENGLI